MQINSKAQAYLKEREKAQQWIRGKVDYRSDELRKPYTFVKDTSHYDCQLPTFQTLNPQLKDLYKRSCLDQDMIDDLESARVLNWCPSAIKLYAVATPRDGNCLVHSVSLAIWGVEDFTHVLRELLLITARNDFHNRFKKRWERQHLHDLSSLVTSTFSTSDQEWEDVIRSISNMGSTTMCAAVPHRFLESVHIYILANILRRPIIVLTDSIARSVSGQSLQENNIGGVYLPLEWDPTECCKTPIIIGYSLSHFCPLISEFVDHSKAREESVFLFPLVNKDLSFLPIRYLREEEERQAWELVQKFFNMKELAVEGDSIHTKIPCAKLVFKPFEKNLFNEHLKLCEERFASVIQAENDINPQTKTRNAKGPYFQIQLSSQTEVVRLPLTSSSQGNVRVGQPVNSCVTKGCLNVGDPNQGNMCDSCLRNFTIAEAGRELISLQDGSIRYYAIDVPCHDPHNAASAAATMGQIVSSVIPTAPPPSFGYVSETEVPLSMLNDRCIKKCGYRSSTQTAPYCHQCFQLEQNKQRQMEENLEPTAPVESMIINEGNVLIESELNIQDQDIIALNSLSSGESSYLPSSISDILKQKDISDTEMSWIVEGNIYSVNLPNASARATPSTGVRPMATLGERSYSKLEELFCKRPGCEGVRLREKDFCLRCSEDLEKSGKLQSIVTPLTTEATASSSSAFPETTVCNNQEDIEISAELSVKCAYPNCETQVRAPNKLCNKCQDILIELSKTQLAIGGTTRENVHSTLTKQNESEMFEASTRHLVSKKELSENLQFQKEMQPPVTPWLKPMEIGHKIDDIQREKERSIDDFSSAQGTLRQTFQKIDDIQREKEKQILEDKSKVLKDKTTEIQREAERQIQHRCGPSKFKFETETTSRRSSSLSPKSSVKNVSSSRGKHCRVSGCQNYGDPSEDNMCSTCYRKTLKHSFPVPRHLESRLHSNTLLQPVAHLTRPTMHPSSEINQCEINQYGTSVQQSSSPSIQDYLSSLTTSMAPYNYGEIETKVDKFEIFKLTFPKHEGETRPTPRHNVVTSKSSFASPYGLQQQPSSDHREADQRFNQVYEKSVRIGEQAKCKMHHCKNYGNPKKVGYCNACYNIYKRQQDIETYGEDVPDKLIN